jgi:16S rRNA (cytosine1402-N4)-methyltransferase
LLARAVERRRKIAPFKKISDVRDVVIQNVPPHLQAKTLTKVFQALRIEVNRELSRLRVTLRNMVPLMEIGGRIVVLSYHSGEDRIIKEVYKEFEKTDSPRLRIVTKKPINPTDAELQINSRARSARLRCAERFA